MPGVAAITSALRGEPVSRRTARPMAPPARRTTNARPDTTVLARGAGPARSVARLRAPALPHVEPICAVAPGKRANTRRRVLRVDLPRAALILGPSIAAATATAREPAFRQAPHVRVTPASAACARAPVRGITIALADTPATSPVASALETQGWCAPWWCQGPNWAPDGGAQPIRNRRRIDSFPARDLGIQVQPIRKLLRKSRDQTATECGKGAP